MDLEGPEGDEPDYHPEELQGHEGEMELFIVPPDPPRAQPKHARGGGKRPATESPQESGQQQPPQRPQPPRPQATTSSSTNSRLKSKVWLDFTKISKDGDDMIIAKCNHCSDELSGKSSNGTSHLLRHTKAKHMTDQATMNNFFLKSETNEDGTTAL
jgi:hypothetical protein